MENIRSVFDLTPSFVENIFLKHLKNYELWTKESKINVVITEEGYSIGFRNEIVCFNVNIIEDIFYLLTIKLKEEYRGKKLGSKLYSILEEIAKELQCKKIKQTPSGWTKDGTTRENYLIKRGYKKSGITVYKDL